MKAIDTSGSRAWPMFLLVFLLLAAGIVAAGYRYYRHYEQTYRVAVERQLTAIAELKVGELVQWRSDRLSDAAVFFKNPSFAALVRRFFANPADADAQRQLLDWVGSYQENDDYRQVRLMDGQGVTRLSAPAGLNPATSEMVRVAAAALRSGQVAIQDFYRNEHDQRVYLAVLVPILDEADASRPLGALVLRIDPETYLYPFIKRWPTPSRTAETLLVRREGNEVVFLNELRFQTNTALNLRAPLGRVALPAVQAVLGREGVMEGMDYRGTLVVAAVRTIPDSPWSVVAKMDTAEVYGPMRERFWQVAVLIGALLLGAGACVGAVWRQQSVWFYRERAETENEARRMVTVVRDSNDAITIQDFEGRITAWNRGAELMYGYREAEALQMSIERLTAPGKVEEQRDFTRRLLAGEAITSLETQRVTKDGRVLDVWMTVTKLVDDSGKPIGIASTERDITARKKEEANMSRMATVVRDSNDAITIQDFEGQITAWNRGAELMYGYSEAEALQMSIERLTAPGKVEEQRDFTRRLLAGEKISSFETQRLTKDGRVLDVWMTVTKLMDDAGNPVGLASTERDITARKRAEEEVDKLNAELEQRVVERTAQLEAANKELESFSYSVSHDLRAPLRHVQGYVDMLARETGGQLSDKGRRYMKTIEDASREMGVLIDDLLAFSRMGRAEMIATRVNLDALVQDTLRDLEPATRERHIVWKIPPLPAVQADPAMLKLVLTNLLGNAVKFTRPRGPAQIEIGCDGMEGERVIIFVRDNGVGFDPQYAHKLFGVFQRLHRADEFEGTGIGLANVRRIIARQGGRVWAEGKLNEGATFYFTLKASE